MSYESENTRTKRSGFSKSFRSSYEKYHTLFVTCLAALSVPPSFLGSPRLSGHFSLREGFTPHGGSTAAVAVSPSSSDHWEQSSHHSTNFHGVVGGQGGNNGYSSPSYSIDLDYNTNNQHHHSNHHHHQQQPPLARGGSMGRLSNGGHFGLSQHVHHHPSIVIDNNNISRQQGQPHENQQQLSSILPRQDSYTSIGDVGVPGNPARLGMSVQDLKHMTAMRMAQQQHTGAGSPDVGAQGSRSQPSTPNDVAQNQRRATGGLVSHGQSNHDAVGLTSRAQQGNPQLLNQHREQMELREQQAAMSSPSLSRHSSAKSMSSFQPQQQHPQASVGGGRPPQLVVGHQVGVFFLSCDFGQQFPRFCGGLLVHQRKLFFSS